MEKTVEKLIIYPIKGLPGIESNSAAILKEGLEQDRRFMLVDSTNTFISQRTVPSLVDFKIKLNHNKLSISFAQDVFEFGLDERVDENINASIWEHKVVTNEISKRLSEWFSDHLKQELKLVRLSPDFKRIKKYSNREGSTEVSLADGYPILVLGTASLDLLNSKLDTPISYHRFRANILVKTEIPHIEDEWNRISFGGSQIEIIKPCARCQVINIDQKSGERFKEPLKTLATYRQKDNKIYFGANASCLVQGSIKLGDVLSC